MDILHFVHLTIDEYLGYILFGATMNNTGGSDGKASACNGGDLSFIPGSG